MQTQFLITILVIIYCQPIASFEDEAQNVWLESSYNVPDPNSELDSGIPFSKVEGETSSESESSSEVANDEILVKLKHFPNYATKLNLRNVNQFPCTTTPGAGCSIVLVPPENHGLLIIVQKLNLRIHVRSSVEYYYMMDDLGRRVPLAKMKVQCRDYVLVSTKLKDLYRSMPNAKLCGAFPMENSRELNNFKTSSDSDPNISKSKQFTSEVNAKIKLTLFHDDNNRMDMLNRNEWELNEDIGGEIQVTSYKDCSQNSLHVPSAYKKCSSEDASNNSSTVQCILGSLFCDGNTNCRYNETEDSDGIDEKNCDEPILKQSSPSPSWKLLSTISTTTTTSVTTPIPILVQNSKNDWLKPLNNEQKKPKPVVSEFNRHLSTAFVILALVLVVALTVCFAFIVKSTKLPDSPYASARRAQRNYRNTSIFILSQSTDSGLPNLSAAMPPPDYPADELPTYDSLFDHLDHNGNIDANNEINNNR